MMIKREDTKKRSKFFEFLKTLIWAVILALLIRTFIVQAYKIPSESMYPTLQVGDHLFVLKFIYGVNLPFINKTIFTWNKPKRGDVIVFSCPDDKKKDYIKRVIGLPYEKIMIKNKQVYINNKPLKESYKVYQDIRYDLPIRDNWYGPGVIPKDNYFVMGDNRDNSQDSRFWGPVDIELIKGKAFLIYWPPWRIGFIK